MGALPELFTRRIELPDGHADAGGPLVEDVPEEATEQGDAEESWHVVNGCPRVVESWDEEDKIRPVAANYRREP
jgi:hypothetical protein